MGRKSRLKKERQRQALAERYEAGDYEVAADPERVERRYGYVYLAIVISLGATVPAAGTAIQPSIAPLALIGGGIAAHLLKRLGHPRLSVATFVLATVWFLVLLLADPARLPTWE